MMAVVRIFAGKDDERNHVSLMERLETNYNVKLRDTGSAFPTGPFSTHRDVYVFAASLGITSGEASPKDKMPPTSSNDITIKESIFREAPGAEELITLMALVSDSPIPISNDATDELRHRVELIAETDLTQRFDLLDRYAYAGFEIIRRHFHGAPRDALLAVLASVRLEEQIDEVGSTEIDPIAYFLK